MTPITWEWFALRAMWFAFGGFIGFFAGFLIASIFAVSSGVSRWEEAQPESEPTPSRDAELAALKTELEKSQADTAFYYYLWSGETPRN